MAHRLVLICTSLALSQTPTYTARPIRPHIQMELVHHTVCLAQFSLVLITLTHGELARLSWSGWLVSPWSFLAFRQKI